VEGGFRKMKRLEQLPLENSSQELAAFTHGILFGLHSLAVYYNLRRGRVKDALVHGAVATYDMIALYRHAKYLKEDELVDRLRDAGL